MQNRITLLFFYLLSSTSVFSQNLPSLLLDRNIQSTFSITAYDKSTKEWGIAVATNNIYVGNATVYIQPGLGAFSVIAETEPVYAANGFQQLVTGKSIEEAIEYTRKTDQEALYRQVAGIDGTGNCYAFTGAALKYWNGMAGHRIGANYIVMGNQLADSVLASMATTFEHTTGTLAERLLKSLVAGQQAGGQINGKQSAALAVKGANNEWFNQIDLRVDHSKTPFEDLQKLLNYHYGRIRLNQALYAIDKGNINRGEDLLQQATTMVEGWNGMYGKIAKAHILLGNEAKAVAIIQKALLENPQWKENLPAFYCLSNHRTIQQLLKPDSFSVKDWNSAIAFLTGINRAGQGIELANKVLKKHPESSYTWYLLGKAYKQEGKVDLAREAIGKAVQLDGANEEARVLLQDLRK
jgi:uncharacterized Ntn-hydrolase superfamily protein